MPGGDQLDHSRLRRIAPGSSGGRFPEPGRQSIGRLFLGADHQQRAATGRDHTGSAWRKVTVCSSGMTEVMPDDG
jgi:hypothetical protein